MYHHTNTLGTLHGKSRMSGLEKKRDSFLPA
jgi:hypothetical protein